MKLKFYSLVKRENNVRSFLDRRRIVTRITAAYYGEDGNEYRKSFEAYGEPVILQRGTHEDLNAKKFQF